MTVGSSSLQVGDHATGNTHDVSWCRTEVVIPRSRSRPHFVVLQQVRVHEHTKLSAVAKGRHTKSGIMNLSSSCLSQRVSRLLVEFH